MEKQLFVTLNENMAIEKNYKPVLEQLLGPRKASLSNDMTAYSADESIARQLRTDAGRMLVRQFRFPPLLRGMSEALIFAGVYLSAGIISLGVGIEQMLGPMVPVVLVMMFCMVASGVYREEITTNIVNLYLHSLYGFFLASFSFILLTQFLPVDYSRPKFIFFFLFFAFFVMNTLRPMLSGTDFMDGGGRRKN